MTTSLSAAIIVARASNGVIGHNNDIPWAGLLPADMNYFQRVTYGQPVIMGRKTYESLPGNLAPLKGRLNIILSRKALYQPRDHSTRADYDPSEVSVMPYGLCGALADCRRAGLLRPFIIGGGQIYKEALRYPEVKTVYITEIGAEYPGDIVFPDLNPEIWERYKSWPQQPYGKNLLPFRWDVYRRRSQ